MLRKPSLLLLLIGVTNCYAQTIFKKGYFITEFDQKTECLIKYEDLRDNPKNFEYKLYDSTQVKTAQLSYIKEFGDVDDNFKYVKRKFKIDKSNNKSGSLSYNRNPTFVNDEAFLKVIVEGAVSLYSYGDGSIKKFFYQKKDAALEQLVYKKYRHSASKIGANEQYKQQLRMALQCSSITMQTLKNLKYQDRSLSSIIIEYNSCMNVPSIIYKDTTVKDRFSLTLRPRFDIQGMALQSLYRQEDVTLATKSSFGFGIEAELYLPFNNNVWSVVVEPTFKSFKSSGENDTKLQGRILVTVDYKTIEIPLSVRRYFYLNKRSKLFTNVSFIFNVDLTSEVKHVYFSSDFPNSDLPVSSGINAALGFGYKLNDKFSSELRYNFDRDILGEKTSWNSSLSSFSIIFGYTIF